MTRVEQEYLGSWQKQERSRSIQILTMVGYFQVIVLVLKDSSSAPASKGFFLAVCDSLRAVPLPNGVYSAFTHIHPVASFSKIDVCGGRRVLPKVVANS